MPTSRFYCPSNLAPGARITLPETAAHHAARVLRLRPGDAVGLFDGHGKEVAAQIETIDRQEVVARVTAQRDAIAESPLEVTLAQAISSGDRMDFTLQKAVELGVSHIQPLESVRSVVRLSGVRADKRMAHWQGVVAAACEQCGRSHVPEVAPIRPLRNWLADCGGGMRLLLAPDATQSLHELPRPSDGITLLIGPEGGFDEGEAAAARAAGFIAARLGPRTLRTETAALAALAAMQTLWGDF